LLIIIFACKVSGELNTGVQFDSSVTHPLVVHHKKVGTFSAVHSLVQVHLRVDWPFTLM
jgi:hypothetical protein